MVVTGRAQPILKERAQSPHSFSTCAVYPLKSEHLACCIRHERQREFASPSVSFPEIGARLLGRSRSCGLILGQATSVRSQINCPCSRRRIGCKTSYWHSCDSHLARGSKRLRREHRGASRADPIPFAQTRRCDLRIARYAAPDVQA